MIYHINEAGEQHAEKNSSSSLLGLAAIMIVVVMLTIPDTDTAEKNPGSLGPPTTVYEITQLQEINASTPNKISSGDLPPGEIPTSNDSQPNKVFAKYENIAKDVNAPGMNVKILSNDENSRTVILIPK